jgi:hypothetical protein
MGRKRAQETLPEVRARLIRDQTRRTEARIRQLLSPASAEEDSEEDSEDREGGDDREGRVVKGTHRSEVGARDSGLCARLLWWLCAFVLFGVCVLVCAVLLLTCLSKVSIVRHE